MREFRNRRANGEFVGVGGVAHALRAEGRFAEASCPGDPGLSLCFYSRVHFVARVLSPSEGIAENQTRARFSRLPGFSELLCRCILMALDQNVYGFITLSEY